jgi:hypothetical protein
VSGLRDSFDIGHVRHRPSVSLDLETSYFYETGAANQTTFSLPTAVRAKVALRASVACT